jgi:hypothetical protein
MHGILLGISISILLAIFKRLVYGRTLLILFHGFYLIQGMVNFARSPIPLTINSVFTGTVMSLIVIKLLIESSSFLYVLLKDSVYRHFEVKENESST